MKFARYRYDNVYEGVNLWYISEHTSEQVILNMFILGQIFKIKFV